MRSPVFVEEGDANSFLGRHLLFNRFDFEIFVPGNLERECYEEVCNYEEAREVFENIPKTVEWCCSAEGKGQRGWQQTQYQCLLCFFLSPLRMNSGRDTLQVREKKLPFLMKSSKIARPAYVRSIFVVCYKCFQNLFHHLFNPAHIAHMCCRNSSCGWHVCFVARVFLSRERWSDYSLHESQTLLHFWSHMIACVSDEK